MINTYKLSTIKDIFDKVPADKIEECCRELGAAIAQAARMRDAFTGEMEMYGITIPAGGICNLPDVMEWVDDSLGNITAHVGVKSESGDFTELFTVETKLQ